jgi:hypothetical protein
MIREKQVPAWKEFQVKAVLQMRSDCYICIKLCSLFLLPYFSAIELLVPLFKGDLGGSGLLGKPIAFREHYYQFM